MAALNSRRVALGAGAGFLVWAIWSTLINLVVLVPRYKAAVKAGQILAEPRYKLFPVYWYITLLIISYALAWLYASVRETRGAGPKTALVVGALVGFAISFPENLVAATFSPFDRFIPLMWMLDLWVGAILATLVAGFFYRE
jgi:uncharacterized membrane protein YoaK (UPF0700 family)